MLAWWKRAQLAEREVLRELDPHMRVPWGLGMRPPSFVTARLMETWAHALDVHAALGTRTGRHGPAASRGLDRRPRAARTRARWPASRRPDEPLRVELTLPSGATWSFGPDDAADRITGPASQFCRVFVQRMPLEDAPELVAVGDGAALALRVARSYL